MATGATITVNNKRGNVSTGEGSSENTHVLRQILAELKAINRQNYVAGRKSESGIGGAGSTSLTNSLLSMLGSAGVGSLGIAGAIAAPILAYIDANKSQTSFGSNVNVGTGEVADQFGYSKVIANGEEQYAKVNLKTQEIVELLTKQEADQQGIIDKTGEIYAFKRAGLNNEKQIFAGLEQQRDAYILTNKIIDEIHTLHEQQKDIDQQILDEKKKILSNLRNQKVGTISLPQTMTTAGAAVAANDALNGLSVRSQTDTVNELKLSKLSSGYSYLELMGLKWQ